MQNKPNEQKQIYEVPDAELFYWPALFAPAEADALAEALRGELSWAQHTVKLFGQKHPAPRLSAWHGDPGASYAYSGTRHRPEPWTSTLLSIRERVEVAAGASFNSVLANRYRSGDDSMGWHSDNESELGPRPFIASLSLGAPRRFILRHQDHPTVEDVVILLEHGSLLLMGGDCQRCWKHRLPKTKKVQEERINLTFRRIVTLMA